MPRLTRTKRGIHIYSKSGETFVTNASSIGERGVKELPSVSDFLGGLHGSLLSHERRVIPWSNNLNYHHISVVKGSVDELIVLAQQSKIVVYNDDYNIIPVKPETHYEPH